LSCRYFPVSGGQFRWTCRRKSHNVGRNPFAQNPAFANPDQSKASW
jgi:hypothetical protein